LNDVAAGIACCLETARIRSAMVLDCDVHQGNGTASIFRQEHRVYTVSLHQENNYPVPKARSSLDIGLEDGTGDDEYLAQLDNAMEKAFRLHPPDLMVFVAGADPYCEDQLGGLHLSIPGLKSGTSWYSAGPRRANVLLRLPWRAVTPGTLPIPWEYTSTPYSPRRPIAKSSESWIAISANRSFERPAAKCVEARYRTSTSSTILIPT